MIDPRPLTLEGHGVRLEPLAPEHESGLAAAAADGSLWELWSTSVPRPEDVRAYIEAALAGQREGHMLPWAVRELSTGATVGTTRYHDIVAAIDRVEIGYTFYGRRWQRSHVNTACKLLLLTHAFDTLGCRVVGLRTDNFNFASQRAIEALGARRDGVLRHHMAGATAPSGIPAPTASWWRSGTTSAGTWSFASRGSDRSPPAGPRALRRSADDISARVRARRAQGRYLIPCRMAPTEAIAVRLARFAWPGAAIQTGADSGGPSWRISERSPRRYLLVTSRALSISAESSILR